MIALASDHVGIELKKHIIEYLEEHNLEYRDFLWHRTVQLSGICSESGGRSSKRGMRKRDPLLRYRDRYFHCGKQGKGDPVRSMLRLLFRFAVPPAQQHQYAFFGFPGSGEGLRADDRGAVAQWRI